MLLDAGCNREDIRIEDNVLGIESDLVHEKTVGAGADPDLVVLGGCLPLLVEGHDDHRRTVAPGQLCPLKKGLLSILQTDGIQDAFSLKALHPLLQHRPLGAIDHDRYPADLGVGCEQIQEGHHHFFAVEHSFVDVHIEDIGSALDLLTRHRKGRLIISGNDELRETGRSGDIRPLADHHEGAALLNGERLKSAQTCRMRRV